jgi:hypothetical protein
MVGFGGGDGAGRDYTVILVGYYGLEIEAKD